MKNLLTPTIIFLTAMALTYFGATSIKPQQSVGLALPQAVAVFETSLQTGITSSATTMTLTANSIRGGGALSGFNCFTVDEGNTNAETICGTVSGTTVSSLSRGISQADGETEDADLQFSHRRGANIKITDFPIIQRLKAQNNGDSTFENQLSYESYLTPTADEDIISKKYADDLAIAGSPDATESVKGISELATQIEMASSTITGGTSASLVLQSQYATSTPSGDSYSALHIPVSENDGFLSQAWLRLSEAFTWTGNHIFGGTTTLNGLFTANATSTMATTTIADLTATDITSSGTSALTTVTSTTFTNSGTASTTDLVISGTCTNCATNGYERNSAAVGNFNGSTDSIATVSVNCSAGKKVIGGGWVGAPSYVWVINSYPSDDDTWIVSVTYFNGSTSSATGMTAYSICVNE